MLGQICGRGTYISSTKDSNPSKNYNFEFWFSRHFVDNTIFWETYFFAVGLVLYKDKVSKFQHKFLDSFVIETVEFQGKKVFHHWF